MKCQVLFSMKNLKKKELSVVCCNYEVSSAAIMIGALRVKSLIHGKCDVSKIIHLLTCVPRHYRLYSLCSLSKESFAYIRYLL